MPNRKPLRPTHLNLALRAALLSLSLTGPLAMLGATPAHAQHAARGYNIPAGPLDAALSSFAAAADITLSFDAGHARGLHSPGLQGEFTAADGLARLLAGSSLEAVHRGDGNYVLRPAPAEPTSTVLPTVAVSGKAIGSTTEGTGSYTTWSTSSSTRLNLAAQETPQNVTVMTRQRLDDQKLDSLTSALDATAGVTVFREMIGADNNSIYMRGFVLSNYAIDGVPTSSSLVGERSSSAIYDRIEIVRGATGLISGLGTPAGVINMIRKRPTVETQFNAYAETGNWNRHGVGTDLSGALNQDGSVRGRLVVEYKDQDHWLDRHASEHWLAYGIAELDLGDYTLLTLGFSHHDEQVDSPARGGLPLFYSNGQRTSFGRSASSAPEWTYWDEERTNLFASIEHEFSNGWSGKVDVGHTRYNYDSVVSWMDAGNVDASTGSGAVIWPTRWKSDLEETSLDAYLTGAFRLFGRQHELIGGITISELNRRSTDYGGWIGPWTGYDGSIDDLGTWNGSLNRPTFEVDGRTRSKETQHGAYLTARFHLTDATSAILGSRFTRWKRDSATRPIGSSESSTLKERENGVVVPYIGLVHALGDTWSIYASHTKIFSPQGSWVRDVNNQALDPEEGTSQELGVKAGFFGGRLNAGLTLFKVKFDQQAFWDNDLSAYTPIANTTTKGVETTLEGQLNDRWQIAAGYTYNVSHDQENERILTQIPKHSVKLFSSYRLPGALEKLTLGGGIRWQSKSGYNPDVYEQTSYAVVDVMARYDINANWQAALNINNLFDKKYYSSVSTTGMLGDPRNAMLTVRYKF